MNTNGRNLRRWLRDIVMLQKTGKEEHFPSEQLRSIGYRSEFLGRRSYFDLGAAISSKCSLPEPKVCVRQLIALACVRQVIRKATLPSTFRFRGFIRSFQGV